MTVFPKSGFKIHLKPAEELVPTTDWFEFLNNIAAKVFEEAGVVLRESSARAGISTTTLTSGASWYS